MSKASEKVYEINVSFTTIVKGCNQSEAFDNAVLLAKTVELNAPDFCGQKLDIEGVSIIEIDPIEYDDGKDSDEIPFDGTRNHPY